MTVQTLEPARAATARKALRLAHLGAGLFLLIAFLGTGQYMDLRYDHLRGVDDTTRMLFRSSHIYILLSALVNLGLGLYAVRRAPGWRRVLQQAGSVLIIGAGMLFLGGFFVEPFLSGLARPLTRPAVYAIFGGGLFHLLSGLRPRLPGRPARPPGAAA